MGKVDIGVGDAITLNLDNTGQFSVEVNEGIKEEVLDEQGNKFADAILNTGHILADGGEISLKAKATEGIFENMINQEGIIRANSIKEAGGKIIFYADNGPILTTGVTDVSAKEEGAKRGRIDIQSDDAVIIKGDAIIKGNAKNNSNAAYINIDGHGRGVLIKDNARVEAKGAQKNSDAGRIFINSYHDVESPEIIRENYVQGKQGIIADNATLDASGGDKDGGWIDFSGKTLSWHKGYPFLIANNNGLGGKLTFDPEHIIFANTINEGVPNSPTYFGFSDNKYCYIDISGENNGILTKLPEGSIINFEGKIISVNDTWDVDKSLGNRANINMKLTGNEVNINHDINNYSGDITLDALSSWYEGSDGNPENIRYSGTVNINGKITCKGNIKIITKDLNINKEIHGKKIYVTNKGNAVIKADIHSTGGIEFDGGGNMTLYNSMFVTKTKKHGIDLMDQASIDLKGWYLFMGTAGGKISIDTGNVVFNHCILIRWNGTSGYWKLAKVDRYQLNCELDFHIKALQNYEEKYREEHSFTTEDGVKLGLRILRIGLDFL